MSARPALAARQSFPDHNPQFRRFRSHDAVAPDWTDLRSWHADDVKPPMSRKRREAEAQWLRLTAKVAT